MAQNDKNDLGRNVRDLRRLPRDKEGADLARRHDLVDPLARVVEDAGNVARAVLDMVSSRREAGHSPESILQTINDVESRLVQDVPPEKVALLAPLLDFLEKTRQEIRRGHEGPLVQTGSA